MTGTVAVNLAVLFWKWLQRHCTELQSYEFIGKVNRFARTCPWSICRCREIWWIVSAKDFTASQECFDGVILIAAGISLAQF
jgi:hypothetical protein